jgi:acetoacetyl-CoA synthetase
LKAPLWTPSDERIRYSNMTAFIEMIGRYDSAVTDFPSLYACSIERPECFWSLLWDFLGILGDKGSEVVDTRARIHEARWFPGASLNLAENLLRRRDDGTAIVALDEGLEGRRALSWRELYNEVARMRAVLLERGVGPGDRVAGCLPNVPEAVIAALASLSLGAVWTACSPEYGLDALLDRFGQVAPKLLFLTDGYRYAGRVHRLSDKNRSVIDQLAMAGRAVVLPFIGDKKLNGAMNWEDFVAQGVQGEIRFERFSFDHPAYILYSSGTTGKPKSLLHGIGGSLLQSAKEIVLHCDCRPDQPVFFQTTTGWMVWNVALTSLAWGAPIVLYDGSPTWPSETVLFDIIASEGVRIARIVPPVLDACMRRGLRPDHTHDLRTLQCILSGSAPLLPRHCEYVYSYVKRDVHLMSPMGGTDIMATLATGNPIGPVYSGEIQCRSLGMSVEICDSRGNTLGIGQAGEMVCTRSFPSVPLGVWGDQDGAVLHEQYFSKFPGKWRHGDWAELTPQGGVIVYGRADAILNVNGVRIGTAEIYRGLESINDIETAVAVAQRVNDGERMLLFIVLRNGLLLDQKLERIIRQTLRESYSPRHVPDMIVQVPDVLRSMNGKPSEIAVRNVINGRDLAHQAGLSNPQLIPLFQELAALCRDSADSQGQLPASRDA